MTIDEFRENFRLETNLHPIDDKTANIETVSVGRLDMKHKLSHKTNIKTDSLRNKANDSETVISLNSIDKQELENFFGRYSAKIIFDHIPITDYDPLTANDFLELYE